MHGSDPVTAIANALTQAGQLAMPYISEHLAQKYESEHQKRLTEILSIVSLSDTDPTRPDRLQSFILRLLGSAGSPAGGLGKNISVPLDVLLSLVAECSESVKKDALLARIQFRGKS